MNVRIAKIKTTLIEEKIMKTLTGKPFFVLTLIVTELEVDLSCYSNYLGRDKSAHIKQGVG
ncbi:MAG: hypothetical protein ACP5PZ_00420 [Bacteroidales bacterium]